MKKIESILITLEFNKDLIDTNKNYAVNYLTETIKEFKAEEDNDFESIYSGKTILTSLDTFKNFIVK